MVTWPIDPGTPAITKYHYHEASGLLESKEDDLGKSTTYTYYNGSKLHTRTWARIIDANPVVTTYGYDPSTGLLINTDYSDSTPDISFTYNRLGLKETITDAQGTRNFSYDDTLQNYEETLSGNLNTTITRTFETATAGALGRSTGISHDLGYTVSYDYDAASGRFNDVSWQVGSATDSATYSFMTDSHLIKDLVYDSGTKSLYAFEPQRNIRNQVKNQFNSVLISQYDYTHDSLGRVESMTTPDDIFASFMPVGQGNAVDFSKSLDVAYAADSVNQYTEITRNGDVTALTYDDDGNMLTDATLTYTWDAENRLIGVEPSALTGDSDKKLEFTYDYMGRRVEKKVFTATMGDYSLSSTTKYLYDGWNLIAELDENDATQAAYIWGLDLSQSLQGAGGVGGLLARVDTTTDKTHLYLYDGNGNVERLVDSADGSPAAVYKYGPYGNLISQAGLYAEVNPFRFSTKYFDGESSLYYYGYRYYAPELGRWVNRDPIGEEGGLNLYGFVGNDSISNSDYIGFYGWNDMLDLGVILGKGIYSVGEDLAFGTVRTGEGLMLNGSDRSLEIGYENKRFYRMGKNLIQYGTSEGGPVFELAKAIALKYHSYLPDCAVEFICKKAVGGGAYIGGRLIIGKKLAAQVAEKMASVIATTQLYKMTAKKIGISVAAGTTGVGLPISGLMVQGVLQRASYASRELRGEFPELYAGLKRKNVDMAYFLVRDPLRPYIQGIKSARDNLEDFQEKAKERYCCGAKP